MRKSEQRLEMKEEKKSRCNPEQIYEVRVDFRM